MKVSTLILAFCFTVNTFAATGSTKHLASLLDDYQYAVTVEWDQKDKAFYEEQTLILLKGIESMIEQGELSVKEVRQVILEKSGDRGINGALLHELQNVQGEVTAEKLTKILTTHSGSMYREGASWAPSAGTILMTGLGILLVVELLVLIITPAQTTCTHVSTESDGDEIWNCRL